MTNFIENVNVYPYRKVLHGIVGMGQILIAPGILLTGIKLIEKNGKRYIIYPVNSENKKNLRYCQPINETVRIALQNALFAEYDKVKKSLLTKHDNTYLNNAISEMVDEINVDNALKRMNIENPSNGPEPAVVNTTNEYLDNNIHIQED